MEILVLGGTQFVGRSIVKAFLDHGHSVTLFHRGLTQPYLFAGIRRILGDRTQESALQPLTAHRWDAVIDVCGYHPLEVEKSVRMLANVTASYLFISSVSVYRDLSMPGLTETSPTAKLRKGVDPFADDPTTYGARKSLCERVVESRYGDRSLIVRPGVLVGPYEVSGRFAYWLQRLFDGGEVLAPAVAATPMQFLDARDLAEWIVRMVEQRNMGLYNAVGPAQPFSFGGFLQLAQRVIGVPAEITWASEAFLLKNGVQPWSELPLWTPTALLGVQEVNGNKARNYGLVVRGLEETVGDTLDWMAGEAPTMGAFLSRERELQLLRLWHQVSSEQAI